MTMHRHKKRRISALKRQHVRRGQALHPAPPAPKDESHPAPDDAEPIITGPITAHALLRYMERVHDIDIEQVRDFLLADGREAMIQAIGTGRIRIDQHCTLVVRDRHVVTILPP